MGFLSARTKRGHQPVPGHPPGDAPALLAALASPATYPDAPRVEVHETHASWVFVAGERAYKVKKPVALGFLDYSTLALRRAACREEVRVNQELAPGIYVAVRAIVPSERGFSFESDGAPGAVEYAVEMRTFREDDTLAGLIAAGSLTRAQVVAVARRLADFHRSCKVADGWGPDQVLAGWARNVGELAATRHPPHWRLDVVGAFGESFVHAHASEIRRRAQLGLVRDGHGDLRCEHVLLRPSLSVVDRVEFDPELRRTDIACDLAFLAMDLEALGRRWAAEELFRAYRQAGMSTCGVELRSFYAAHWALVRAKVAVIAASEREAQARAEQLHAAHELWTLSESLCWRARAPLAVVVCGPAASGKSVLAAELGRRSEMTVVSSDAVRKQLAHLPVSEPARPEHYSAAFTRATYEQLAGEALDALGSRGGVIVDATCRSREDRALLLDRLQDAGTRRLVVRCEVPLAVALERAAQRMHDPGRVSDATPEIVQEQFSSFEELDELPAGSVLRLDSSQTIHAQVADVASAVDHLGAASH